MEKDLKKLWKIYRSKAPVNRQTSQIRAFQAYQVIKPYLTKEEISKIETALGHALFVGEGRREFDHICTEIEKRLFQTQPFLSKS
jgi:hypothetical protein